MEGIIGTVGGWSKGDVQVRVHLLMFSRFLPSERLVRGESSSIDRDISVGRLV